MATGIGYEYGTSPLPEIRAGKTGDYETITAAGAVSIATEPTRITLTQAGDQALTLADGDEAQRKLIYLATKGSTGNAVLTPANLTGGTTLTFDTAGDYAELRFLVGSWVVVNSTATLA